MNVQRAILLVAGSAGVGAAAGVSIGFVLGRFLPDYYRSIFARGDEPHFDPVAVGVGQGLTQGLVAGALIGVLLVAIFAWHDSKRGTR